MPRTPSHELIRLLLTYWQHSDKRLDDVRSAIVANPEVYKGFDVNALCGDIDECLRQGKGGKAIRELAKPVVLCFADVGQKGKSSLVHLLAKKDLWSCSTDKFVGSLASTTSSEDAELGALAKTHVPSTIDQFIRKVEANSTQRDRFVRRLVEWFMTAHPKDQPLLVLEGMVHHPQNGSIDMAQDIFKELRRNGYRVWFAKRYPVDP